MDKWSGWLCNCILLCLVGLGNHGRETIVGDNRKRHGVDVGVRV